MTPPLGSLPSSFHFYKAQWSPRSTPLSAPCLTSLNYHILLIKGQSPTLTVSTQGQKPSPIYISESTALSVGKEVSGTNSVQQIRLYYQSIMFHSDYLCLQAGCLHSTGSLPLEHQAPHSLSRCLTCSHSVNESWMNNVGDALLA